MKEFLAKTIATWFGSGLSKKAPGTFGSIASMPFAIFFAYNFGFIGVSIATIVIFVVGLWSAGVVTKDLEEKDLQSIVVDETVGIMITFLFLTPYLYKTFSNWWLYILGFLAFRFFDILKFGIVKHFDSKNSALGVMLDDVFAGIRAGLFIFIIVTILSLKFKFS